MMSISTDKKLELLRGIRLENQRNHQLMQERQHILEAPSFRETSMGNMDRGKGTSPGWRSLRFRIFVSFLLLGGFIVAHKMEWHYHSLDCDMFLQQMNESVSLEQLMQDGRALLNHEKASVK